MTFIFEWLAFYFAIMFAMSVDNIFWIPNSPEYGAFKEMGWFKRNPTYLVIGDNIYYTKLGYIWRYRIKTVLTHPRDIIPGIITSAILTWIF